MADITINLSEWRKGVLFEGKVKPCRVCNITQPLSGFKADRSKTGGRRATCKACIKAGQNGQPQQQPGMKWCPHCKTHKPLEEFAMASGVPCSYCRTCRAERHRAAWGTAPSHQPSHRALTRNKETVRAWNQTRQAMISGDPLLKKLETERKKQDRKRAYRKDPQKFIIRGQIARAKRLGTPGEFSKRDLAEKFREQNGKCYYCECDIGAAKDKPWNVEHLIPLSRGGTNFPDNIAVSCATCNFSKATKTPWEFMPEKFSPPQAAD